jgi:hypothetical protein
MEQTVEKIFNIDELKEINLNEDDKLLDWLMEHNIDEIEAISSMEDSHIEKLLVEYSGFNRDSHGFDLYLKNLKYIKQSYFIEKKEIETKTLDIETIKEIKLDELIDFKDFRVSSSINIEADTLDEIVKKKNEEKEKWKEYNVESTISNKTGIPESNIRFINELSEYIAFVSELDPAYNYVSRGQKDCTYDLLPSLHRQYKKDYEIHSDRYEGAFKQKIIFYDREIRNKSDEELRAEGQHFGLPTDYLDFTEAHLISLLFAIEDYQYTKQHSIVYFIDSVSYNAETVDSREKLIDYSVPSVVESMKKYSSSRSYFVKLGNSNERIHFQKGCFLKVSNQDKEEFQKKLANFCKVVIINKEFKKDILKELFNLGITFENIYPDKDNVVKSIRFHFEELTGGSE